jgi:5'-3' exonuclease
VTSETKQPHRVYLVDASIYVFRAWFTYPVHLSDSDGYQANAVYGYADFLTRLLKSLAPAYIACAFDQSLDSSFRSDIFPAYKANREPAPEELKRQFEYCRQLTRSLGVAEFASDRFEADDLIGTLAMMMRAQGHPVTVISADKDLTQLVHADHDEWWDYARGIRLDRHGVRRRFGVEPSMIADLLALAGDAVDNIPGVPGVGPKTAASLLNRFGNLDGIYQCLDDIPGSGLRSAKRVHALLEKHEAEARLALSLTRVYEEVPIDAGPDALSWKGVDRELLDSVAEQVGFSRNRFQNWLPDAADR